MKKQTKLSIQWFYTLLERGECDIMDFKEQLENKTAFGKSLKNFAPKYDETARDVVAFANNKGGFLFIGIVDGTKEINKDFVYNNEKVFDLIHQIQDRVTELRRKKIQTQHSSTMDDCELHRNVFGYLYNMSL